ncbi:secondary thiamine-phosphate synthase enzyme YjbQ [Patescibacteria group bacterium]
MKIYKKEIQIKSSKQVDFIDITDQIRDVVSSSGIRQGQALIFAQHTTMSVIVNHKEDMLEQDLMRMLDRIAPMDQQYSHDLFEIKKNGSKADGRSNGHSHCKSFLMGNSATIPFDKGELLLSDLQTIFAIDFDGSRDRDVLVQVMGL